jgi:hypothetical protein
MTAAPVPPEVLSASALIQAALAPVFLLTANASTLILIDTRQNRIVDRLRLLEAQALSQGASAPHIEDEVAFYLGRARRVGRAAASCTLSALGIALAVVCLFVDAQIAMSLNVVVEAIFTLAVTAYVTGLAIYLRDVFAVNDALRYMNARIHAALQGQRRPGP